MDRYSSDVLAKGWQQAGRRTAVPTPVERDLVLEEPTSGFVGAVVGWENGLVVLEDRLHTLEAWGNLKRVEPGDGGPFGG